MRTRLNFNREWKFQLGDHPGAESVAFDDSTWASVGLPHSFSLPYFGSPQFYVGYGWYRKTFLLPRNLQGQRVFLDFEGVFQDAEVFVNGHGLGRHRGGYTGFVFDITAALHPGENLVAVRVNNLWDARLAPRAGEHVFSGGIYRNVSLVFKNPVHVAWYGTRVTTPEISHESANVRIETELVNTSGKAREITVRQTLFDPGGRKILGWQSSAIVLANQSLVFDQVSPDIPRPRLWHPDDPALYTVKTTVWDGDNLLDEVTTSPGFRWFEWSADHGFLLNGEHLYLYGANVHQDHAGWGDAVTDAGFERDVRLMKEAGFNFIRGSHYPHAPAFSAACDRLGMLFWSEATFWGIGGFVPDGYWNSSAYPPHAADQPEFEASVKAQLEEMIRIHRNHPSIVAWSLGNETFFSEKAVMGTVKAFLGDLVKWCRNLDPTRPAAIGGVQRPLDHGRIDLVGDIAGYNGDGASLPQFQHPGIPNIVAEYGSTTAIRPGKYDAGWDHLAASGGKPAHAWRAGQAIWCGFDHGSIAGDNLGRMGIVDYFRIPKRAWYWYRNEYRRIPPPVWPGPGVPTKLKLEADKTELRAVDGTDDCWLQVTVLDKAGQEIARNVPVTLEIVSGPGEFPTGPSITFASDSDIAILDGKAAIEFRTYFAGTTVIRASSPGLEPAEITIVSHGEPQWLEGVTPPVEPRPYHRWTASHLSPSSNGINLAADRPTKASSNAQGFTSASATDGSAGTVWRSAPDDPAPWIRIDLENTYHLERVRLTFSEASDCRYTVAVSTDGNDWKPISRPEAVRTDVPPEMTGDFGQGIRFLRVLFSKGPSGRPAELAGIEAGGGPG